MIKYGYDAGFKALKEIIIPSLIKRNYIEKIEKYTFSLLNRTCKGWMK